MKKDSNILFPPAGRWLFLGEWRCQGKAFKQSHVKWVIPVPRHNLFIRQGARPVLVVLQINFSEFFHVSIANPYEEYQLNL